MLLILKLKLEVFDIKDKERTMKLKLKFVNMPSVRRPMKNTLTQHGLSEDRRIHNFNARKSRDGF